MGWDSSLEPPCGMEPTWHHPDVCVSRYHEWDHSATSDDDAGLGFESDSSGGEVSEGPMKPPPSRLLFLPAEIRLQIYHWLYLMNPICFRKLSAAYPTPRQHRYRLRRVVLEEQHGGSDDDDDDESAAAATGAAALTTNLLSPDRPLCSVPVALLRACKQIYYEARGIPFANNEFVFLNWFSSGLHTAAALTRLQTPWQRSAVRYVRMEVMAKDLVDENALKEWAELCGRYCWRGSDEAPAWAQGLRNLRLSIVDMDAGPRMGMQAEDGSGGGSDEAAAAAAAADCKFMDAAGVWAREGRLADMQDLERIEVEIEKWSWGKEKQLAWCERLQGALKAMGSRAQIVCTEKAI